MTADEADDDALVKQAQGGDAEAFRVLVERHQDEVAACVARRLPVGLVAEVAQEVFVQAWLSLPGFTSRGAVNPELSRWLSVLAVRACHDHWRRHYRERRRGEGAPLPESPAPAADRELEDREWLHWALDQLEPDDRAAVTLVALDGLSVREAADVLEWSESKTKVRAHRARRRLREILARAVPESGVRR